MARSEARYDAGADRPTNGIDMANERLQHDYATLAIASQYIMPGLYAAVDRIEYIHSDTPIVVNIGGVNVVRTTPALLRAWGILMQRLNT